MAAILSQPTCHNKLLPPSGAGLTHIAPLADVVDAAS